jgi:hypothetical protein
MTDEEEKNIRRIAQEAYGADQHEDFETIPDAPVIEREHGYWVRAEVWVPKEWVK